MIDCEVCFSKTDLRISISPSLSYWICQRCGHCRIHSKFDDLEEDFKAAQSEYFGDQSLLVENDPSPLDREILFERQRIALTYLTPQSTVLEVGPGSGFFSDWLMRQGHRVILFEQSPFLADFLKDKLGIYVESGEFESKDIPGDAADAFCSFHVIEHVPDPLRHLVTGFKAVRPGGIALVATPNARSWEQVCFPRLSPNFDSAHLRVFSPSSLRQLCERAGWEVVHTETAEFTASWLRVLSKGLRGLRREDEKATAGKYAKATSAHLGGLYAALVTLTRPVRYIQRRLSGGNEVFLVLRKPMTSS